MEKYKLCFNDQILSLFNIKLPYYWFQLDKDIDVPVFEEAVNKALYYHPTFNTSLEKQKGLYYLVPNHKRAKVRTSDWDTDITFTKSDNNGYPWRFVVIKNDFIFTGSHSITDGSGAYSFIHTVLRMYYELLGEKFTGDFALVKEDKIAETIIDPYTVYAVDNVQKPFSNKKAENKKPYIIPKELFETDDKKLCIKQFIFDENEIKNLGKDSDTSTFAIIAVILAKSLARSLNIKEGNIDVSVANNLRIHTNANTDRNFASTPNLKYDIAKGEKLPLDIWSTALRSQLDIILDHDNLIYDITQMNNRTNFFSKNPLLLQVVKLLFGNQIYTTDARINYTHITKPGIDEQILKHINIMQIIPAKRSVHKLNLVLANNFKGKIYVNIYNTIKNKVWAKSMEEVIKEFGISYTAKECQLSPNILYEDK